MDDHRDWDEAARLEDARNEALKQQQIQVLLDARWKASLTAEQRKTFELYNAHIKTAQEIQRKHHEAMIKEMEPYAIEIARLLDLLPPKPVVLEKKK